MGPVSAATSDPTDAGAPPNPVKGILFDLDGVFHVGDQAVPGAAGAIAWAHKNAIPYLFLTNTFSRPREAIVARLSTFGLSIDVDRILTPAVAATGIRAVVIGKPAQAFFLTAAHQRGKEPADLLMVGDDIRRDIEGAQRADLTTAPVRTGKFNDSDLSLGIRPDAIPATVADLPRWRKDREEHHR